mmetsp:Transcript_93939/g.253102  ORF Transcript_93939/g.253102 Transcript_93939/m.253102 type:complete len:82 (-) Transcript_93939:74-319(-)
MVSPGTVFSLLVLAAMCGAVLLAWLSLPPAIFSVLFGFAMLEGALVFLAPDGFPVALLGFLHLPLYLSGCAIFLALQTPQM